MSILKYPRSLHTVLLRDLELYPVVALMGARQVGKSTLGREIAEARGMAYRTLDDRGVLEQALRDPEGLLDELGDSGFIDEAQRAPGLFLSLKAVVDREQRPGQYLLSGSNQPQISGAVGDSLLGRAAYRTLRPLTLSELRLDETPPGWNVLFEVDTRLVLEYLERRASESGPLDWRIAVETGGMPRAVAAPSEMRRQLLNDYVETFAARDIRELLAIESGERFEQFMRLVASRTGQVLNASGLSSDLGVSVNTVRRWIGALERSYLVELVPPYSRNASHRVIKAPKLFFGDVALALAASQESEPTGFHLENLVANDAAVWRDAEPGRAIHHWRTQSGQEVDLVLELNRRLLPVELKATTAVGYGDARHLTAFLGAHPATVRGLLVSADHEIREIGDKIVAAPWWSIL